MPSVAIKSRLKEPVSEGSARKASDAQPSRIRSGAELAGLLDTTSFDGLRLALTELSRHTSLKRFDERLEANDARIQLANDFLSAGGRGHEEGEQRRAKGLMQAWDVADAQRNTVLLSLTLNCLATLIQLLGAHQPNHERGEELILAVLSSDDAVAGRSAMGQGPAWHRLQTYLAEVEPSSGAKKATASAKGKQADSGAKSDDVTLAVLHVLLAISSFGTAKFARTLFDSMPWSMRSLPRLMNMRKRIAQRKRDGKKSVIARGGPSAATLEKPDIRTTWILILLSFLRSPSGACTSVTLRIAALSLGREFYPAIVKGLAQDPAPIVVHVLMGLHDGLLSDQAASKLPRSKVVGVFNEWTCKALVDLYGRDGDMLQLVQFDEQHSIADVTHHFLLALCTHPGRGVCYVDDGWYGKVATTERSDEVEHNDAAAELHKSGATSASIGIFNKILFGILRSLLPTRSPKQGELALRILAASPELTGPYLRTWLSVEPKVASISWLSASTFFTRALSIALPSFRDKDGRWRAVPPSMHACLDALLPDPISKSMFARGLQVQDRLARFAAMSLLAQVAMRLLAFRHVCREASQSQRWDDASQNDAFDMFDVPMEGNVASMDEILTGQVGQRRRQISPWQRLWDEVMETAKDRLPDITSLLTSLVKKRDVVEDTQKEGVSPTSSDDVLEEVTLRDCWLLQELFKDSIPVSASDLDKLFNFSFQHADKENDGALSSLTRLHAIRAIASYAASQHGGLDIFVRASSAGQSHLARLLRMQSEAEMPMLQQTAQELIQTAMTSSLLFEHDRDEWQAWQYALPTQSTDLLDFLDECTQRCTKTAYRYVEIARKATLGDGDDGSEVGLIASPLFFCMLEQYCIRLRKGLLGESAVRRTFLPFARLLLLGLVAQGRKPSKLVSLLEECERAARESHDSDQGELLAQLEHTRSALLGFEQQQASSTSKIGRENAHSDLDELHPAHDNIFRRRRTDSAVPICVYATHLAYAGKGKSSTTVSWDGAQAIDAKLLFLAAMKRLLSGSKDSSVLTDLCLEALQRGAFDHKLLRSTVFGRSDLRTNEEDAREALVRIVSEGPFSPADEQDRQLVAPLVQHLLGAAETNGAEAPWSHVTRLLPFMELSAVQDITSRLLTQGRRLDCVCAMVISTPGLQLAEESISEVVEAKKSTVDAQEAAFILRILSSAQISGDLDSAQAQSIVDFVLQHADHSDVADNALLSFLKRHPKYASVVLSAYESSEDMLQLLQRMPFAVARASQLIEATESHASLLDACAALLFQGRDGGDVGAAMATAIVALLQKSSDDGSASASLCRHVPDQPGQAFNVHALLMAAELVAGDANRHAAFLRIMTEKTLLWLVRRFAEDDEDMLQTVQGVQAFNEVLLRDASTLHSLAHLVDPVLTAAIRRRLASPLHAELVRLLLTATPFASSKKQQFLSEILHNRAALAADADVRSAAVCAASTCIAQDASVASADLVAALVPLYNGTLSRDDRQIFHILCTHELQHKVAMLDALKRWSGGVEGGSASPHEEIIWRLDANRLLESCLRFPRARSFYDLHATGYDVADAEAQDDDRLATVYDPLLVLAALGQYLSRKGRRAPTGLQLIELLRTNALGVLACCLSSRYDDVRRMASTLFAKVYAYVHTAGFHEKDQLLVTLDAMRTALGSEGADSTVAPMPMTTTLFVAHALRAQAQPSLYLYPLVSRFLLQRAAPLDRTDVPLLYSFLFSSSHQSSTYRQERTFILRFLAACVRFGGRAEWRIMKRRHVWHSIASLYTSAARSNTPTDASLRHAIEEVWDAASHKQHVAQHVIVRLGFLQYVQQLFALHPPRSARDRSYWAQLLCRLLATLDLQSVHNITGGAWLSSFAELFDSLLTAVSDATPSSDAALFASDKHMLQIGSALGRCFTFVGEVQEAETERHSMQVFARLTKALLQSVHRQVGAEGGDVDERRTTMQDKLIGMTTTVVAALSPLCTDATREDLRLTTEQLRLTAWL